MYGPGATYSQKAYAYVTRANGDGRELLVFRERADPDAGIQVPKGGIDDGEAPCRAVRRELREEAGLEHDRPVYHVASDRYRRDDGKRVARHFFHFPVEESRDGWDHEVTGGGEDDGLVYELSWSPLPLSSGLAAGMDAYVPLVE
ncbi:NUDIX hydrolase [Halalkalicoccus tibetensis]|uniref:NUDIX domain-containing protein n=1 Tax=Halalkalicoccus tibetensis TaxID=175632 RepID=A0ABD5V4G5_9EURY